MALHKGKERYQLLGELMTELYKEGMVCVEIVTSSPIQGS